MFDNKNVESAIRTRDAVPQAEVCVCVCVCVCVRRALKLTGKLHFALRARPNDQIHTQYVKTAGLETIHLNTVYVLKWTRTVGRKLCVSYFVLVTDWCFINVNQRENHPQLLRYSYVCVYIYISYKTKSTDKNTVKVPDR